MHREVYYALNLPMGTVKTHLHRAKRSPPALLDVIGSDLGARVRSQVQTLAMALVLLTMTLGLWWWAEADPGP